MSECKNILLKTNVNDIQTYNEKSRHIPTNVYVYENIYYNKYLYKKEMINTTYDIVNNCKKQDISFESAIKEIDEGFLIVPKNIHNYYHFIMDFVSKIVIYKELNLKCKIYCDFNFILSFQKQWIELLDVNFENLNINTLFKKAYICSDSVGLATKDEKLPIYPLISLRKLLRKENCVREKNIYISRKNNSIRKIENEEEFELFLKRKNFETVYLENMLITEQIELFSKANIVIAPHGAGAINLIFSNAKLYIEIHDVSYIYYDDCFFQICNILDIEYLCIHSKSTAHPHFSNFIFSEFEYLENVINENL